MKLLSVMSTKWSIRHSSLHCQKVLNPKRRSTAGIKILIFQTTNKTLKDHYVIMYFFLQDRLGESLCKVEIHNLHDEPSVVRLVVLLRLGPFDQQCYSDPKITECRSTSSVVWGNRIRQHGASFKKCPCIGLVSSTFFIEFICRF